MIKDFGKMLKMLKMNLTEQILKKSLIDNFIRKCVKKT